MDPKKIDTDLTVSPQIELSDLAELKRQGFAGVISNRPDGETPDQPSFEEVARAAEAAGLEARHVPVNGGDIGDADADQFDAALKEIPGPALAFCRTGKRSVSLWALNEAERRPVAEILRTAEVAGYDIEGLRDRLEAISAGTAASDRKGS